MRTPSSGSSKSSTTWLPASTATGAAAGTTAPSPPTPGERCIYGKSTGCWSPAGIELRLAESGEGTGRLVHIVDEARADLIERTLDTPYPKVAGRVEHAIALFRARDADAEDKRSAIVALAAVLEDRRALLKKELFRSDEGALFRIANEFDLRHQNDKQHTDYDPAFRDWVFWWYLATIELSDRLLARQITQTSTATL